MRALCSVLTCIAMAGCAATPMPSGPPLQVAEVIAVDGRNAAQLCNGARDWTAKTFHDSKAVVEVFDLQRGRLIGKGSLQVPVGWMNVPIAIKFTMTIDCKDGRVRAAFDDYGTGTNHVPLFEDATYRLQSKARSRTLDLIADLRQYLSSPPKSDF